MFFSKSYSVYFKSIFYSNSLVYWANISHTNVIQDTEQRFENETVKYVKLCQFPIMLKSINFLKKTFCVSFCNTCFVPLFQRCVNCYLEECGINCFPFYDSVRTPISHCAIWFISFQSRLTYNVLNICLIQKFTLFYEKL
jgi:hypothetical protein